LDADRGSDDMTVWWQAGWPVSTMCKSTRVAQKAPILKHRETDRHAV
jgi:hypothetical protein